MQLFRDEVYKIISAKKAGGIETALQMIIDDKRLHDTIRQYAIAHGISKKGWGDYGVGDPCRGTLVRKDIRFWQQNETQHVLGVDAESGCIGFVPSVKNDVTLSLGPDPKKQVMPIYLNHSVEDTFTGVGGGGLIYVSLLVEKKKDGFYVRDSPELANGAWRQLSRYHNMRITDTGLFGRVTVEQVLTGLEKAVREIIAR